MKAFKIIALGILGLVISTSSYGQEEVKPAPKQEAAKLKLPIERKMVKRAPVQEKKPMQKADLSKKATPAKLDPANKLEKKSPTKTKQPIKKAEAIESEKK